MYAYKYTKDLCNTVDDACTEFVLDNFSDCIRPAFYDYIDCAKWVKEYLKLEIVESDSAFVILSEYDVDDLISEHVCIN